eukprot:jgi/Tetstr1/453354/TSEL_040345.t1
MHIPSLTGMRSQLPARCVSAAPAHLRARVSVARPNQAGKPRPNPRQVGSRVESSAGNSGSATTDDVPKWIQHANRVFDLAEEEITDYHEYLEEDDKRKALAAEVLDWLKEKREVLVEGCMLDGGKVGDECTSLERLERLVEDLEYECGVEDMVHILACQCHAERGNLTKSFDMCESPAALSTLKDNMLFTEDELRAIFELADLNSDGRLNMMEFSDAMDEMGDQLSPGTLEAITVAFDLHGAIDFEQFKEIVSAEELRPHTRENRAMRRLLGKINPEHTPDWGT